MTYPSDIRIARVYWVLGDYTSKQSRYRQAIRNPPVNGWSTVVVIGEPDAKRFTLLCPFTLSAYNIKPDTMEYDSLRPVTLEPQRLIDLILDRWDAANRHGLPADFHVATLVLRRLGATVPTIASHTQHVRREASITEEGTESGRKKSAAAAPTLLAPVNPKHQIGKVLKYLLENPGQSIKAAQIDLDVPPHSLRGVISTLKRKHGIGIRYEGDAVFVDLPGGCSNPFME